MNGGDSEAQAHDSNVREACPRHSARELLLVGEIVDRNGEIAVRRRMPTHEAAEPGQHVVKIESVEGTHDRRTWHRELQDHERRSSAEDAKRLGDARVEVLEVPSAEGDDRA